MARHPAQGGATGRPLHRIAAVIPIRDKKPALIPCLASLDAAGRADGNVTLVLVDNGSTDGALDVQREYADRALMVASSARRVGGVRNDGARAVPDVDVYAFIDSDCVVPEDFFAAVRDTFAASGAAAVGCEVVSPADGHWTERTWDALHRPQGDGPRHYMNSACFCILADWFWRIGGFDEEKVSSEDVDICWRLTAAGGTMWQSERLRIVHLGNPKSVGGVYARVRWHGRGIWEPGKGLQWSKITLATFAHAGFVVAGALLCVATVVRTPGAAVLALVAGVVAAPFAFTVARMLQFRRRVPLVRSVALMVITFFARLHGLADSLRTAGVRLV